MNTINSISYNQPAFQSRNVLRGNKTRLIKIPIEQKGLVQSRSQRFFNRFLNSFGLANTSALKIDISGLNKSTYKKRPRLYSIENMIASANRALQRVINNK